MGRQNNDPTMLYSSIALLQERFRQLQRIKEMREERQLLQMLAEARQPRWFFHPDLVQPTRPLHGSPSLQTGRYCESTGLQPCKTHLSIDFWCNNADMHASNNSNETDVDTSLHL